MWSRQDGMDQVNNTDYIIVGIIIFSLIGLFSRNPIVFIVIGIFATYLILSNYYNKVIAELKLANPRSSIRLFPGEEAKVIIELENESPVPIINGHFSFQVDSAISVLTHSNEDQNKVNVLLSVIGKRKTILELPICANFRGVSKIRNINYTFPHLLNFSSVTLAYSYFFHTEVIVFPKLINIHGIDAVFQMVPGDQRMNFSPFEDVQSLIGTRDYHYGDPFQRINWKATAKTQQLQTNMYEMVVDMTYVFIVNIGVEKSNGMSGINKQMEKLLSYVAYASNYAREKGFPFEIYINGRKPGAVPFIHVPEGAGKVHYLYALETLARIHNQSMIVPFDQMIYRLGMNLFEPKTMILFGDISYEASQVMNKWGVKGHSIYQVTTTDDVAVLKPWLKDAIYDAK